MTSVLIKRRNLVIGMYAERTPCDNAGYISPSQGTPKTAKKPLESKRQAWNTLSLTALRKNQLYQHLDFRLEASEL